MQGLGSKIKAARNMGSGVHDRSLAVHFVKLLQQATDQQDENREVMVHYLCEAAVGNAPLPDEMFLQVCKCVYVHVD